MKSLKAKFYRKKLEKASIILLILGLVYSVSSINNKYNQIFIQETPKASGNVDYEWNSIWSLTDHTYPSDITTDSKGNIYITGDCKSSTTESDFFLMNIDEMGNIE
ncbi:MAG: SBBP repeat-containing protein [Candidatus Lokiarchaeota archaeon]|nr:SBBP repeat-containing protein [Candidatus Lokiarchaeota archaeon]